MNQGKTVLRAILLITALGSVAGTGAMYAQARLQYSTWMQEHSSELQHARRIIARHERRLDSQFYSKVPVSVYRADLAAADRATPVFDRLDQEFTEHGARRQRALLYLQLALGAAVFILFVVRVLTPYEPRWQ